MRHRAHAHTIRMYIWKAYNTRDPRAGIAKRKIKKTNCCPFLIFVLFFSLILAEWDEYARRFR